MTNQLLGVQNQSKSLFERNTPFQYTGCPRKLVTL